MFHVFTSRHCIKVTGPLHAPENVSFFVKKKAPSVRYEEYWFSTGASLDMMTRRKMPFPARNRILVIQKVVDRGLLSSDAVRPTRF